MKNPFAKKNTFAKRKKKTDILNSWHSELNNFNKDHVVRTVLQFDLSKQSSSINCDTKKPRRYLGLGFYVEYLEEYLTSLDSNVESTRKFQGNIPRAIEILNLSEEKRSVFKKWNYQSIAFLPDEMLQFMKEFSPYLSPGERQDIIKKLRTINSLLKWQEEKLIAIRPKIVETIRHEKKTRCLAWSVLACALVCTMFVYIVKVSIPRRVQAEARWAQAEIERNNRLSKTLDRMISSGRCGRKNRAGTTWSCSKHETLDSPVSGFGYRYRETVYLFNDGEDKPYTSVKVFDYRADCEGCTPYKPIEIKK